MFTVSEATDVAQKNVNGIHFLKNFAIFYFGNQKEIFFSL